MYKYLVVSDDSLKMFPVKDYDKEKLRKLLNKSKASCYLIYEEHGNLITTIRKDEDDSKNSYRASFFKEVTDILKEFNRMFVLNQLDEEIDLVFEFPNEVNWDNISNWIHLPEVFIEAFEDKLNWDILSDSSNNLDSENLIRKYKDKINWKKISKRKTLSEDFIREFQDDVDWDYISSNQTLSQSFIAEFSDKVNWKRISKNQRLSEDFIRIFDWDVDWDEISKNQMLSEDFIREFADEVNWSLISKHQILSEKFKKEFSDRLS